MTDRTEPVKTLSFQYDLNVVECPCGSGKKPEKCCGPVKPRTYLVDLDPRNFYESEGLAVGLDHKLKRIVKGKLKPLIGTPRLTQSYKRKKKKKVLVEGEVYGEYVMHPDSVLLGFEQIFSIDTNTWCIDEHKVSVSGVLHAYVEKAETDNILYFLPITAFEFWDAEVEPERLGWYALIQATMTNEEMCGKRTALIVDSGLGCLEGINKRELPIVGDFYLPENFKLIYASADIGSNMSNKLIKLSDRLSTAQLEKIKGDPKKESLYATEYACRWFRQWND